MKILLLCYGCGITLEPGTTACDNCGIDKDLDKKSWIKAILSDEEGERLEVVTGFMLDNSPDPTPYVPLTKTLMRSPIKGGKRK
jgi:hypothetical protein